MHPITVVGTKEHRHAKDFLTQSKACEKRWIEQNVLHDLSHGCIARFFNKISYKSYK